LRAGLPAIQSFLRDIETENQGLSNMWLFVPVQQKLKEFFGDFEKFPYQAGTSLNAAGVSYQTIRMSEALKRLGQLETMALPNN
jgi:arylsulfatase